MRLPIKLPKITKYNDIVIAGGTNVWIQIRKKRVHSLIQIVFKPVKTGLLITPLPV